MLRWCTESQDLHVIYHMNFRRFNWKYRLFCMIEETQNLSTHSTVHLDYIVHKLNIKLVKMKVKC